MSRYTIEGETLTGIADAVRSITGGETLLTPAQIEAEIEGTAADMQEDISDLKTILSDINAATASDVGKALSPKTVSNGRVTEWQFKTDADPSVIASAVDDWLDEHPEATTTVDFSIAVKVFPTVADMVADSTLESGDNVATRGYYASGDNGGFNYVVSSTHSGTFYITLGNGLYANRLTEDSMIHANTIGIKCFSTKVDALDDESTMESNQEIAQAAIDAGFGLIFGEGHYAFDDALSLKVTTNILGYKRELTRLYFPNSIGLNFDRNIEYHYQFFRKFRLESLGNCINILSTVYNVINCKFDNLWLISEEGECIVAPRNNNGARGSTDTCVWSCVFSRIHAESKTGAMFANIKGLGNWFYYILMLGDTKWAFRNCSGTFVRLDTGATHPKVCFYFDDVEDYGLTIFCKEVHFEACEESFIFTEDETMSTMALGVYLLDSGVTRPQMSNSDKPFMKAGRFTYIYHYGSYSIMPSESLFDMEALNGAIYHSLSLERAYFENFKTNIGGTSGLKIYAGTTLYKFYAEGNRVRYGGGGSPYETRIVYESLGINTMYGGRSHQVLTITEDNMPSNPMVINLKNIAPSEQFCDGVVFKLTANANLTTLKRIIPGEEIPGRFMFIKNHADSTKDIKLQVYNHAGDNGTYCLGTDDDITLSAGKSVLLYSKYSDTGILRWYPIGGDYTLPDASSSTKGGVLIEDTPTENSTKAITSGGLYTALAGKQSTLTFDNVPTTSSNNPVKSGGVKSAIDELSGQVIKIDANGYFYVDE